MTTLSPARAGQRRDAHVDQLSAQRQPDPAILRNTAFGDVKPRHDLDPADNHRCATLAGRRSFSCNTPSCAHSYHQPGFIGLNMNIGHTLPHRLCNDAVDQADNRRVIGAVEQIVGTRQHVG